MVTVNSIINKDTVIYNNIFNYSEAHKNKIWLYTIIKNLTRVIDKILRVLYIEIVYLHCITFILNAQSTVQTEQAMNQYWFVGLGQMAADEKTNTSVGQ